MDTLQSLMLGFSVVTTPMNLFYCFVGVLIGTLVGVLPGIGTAGSVAVLLPFTFGLPPGDGHHPAGRHLVRRHVRRVDHLHPGEHPR